MVISPVILSIDPTFGSVLNNILVTITGLNFTTDTVVYVNTELVISTYIGDTSMTVIITPEHIVLPVDIYVSNLGVNSNVVLYTYLPDIRNIRPYEITDLDQHIVIHGVGLNETMGVYFNETLCHSTFKNHKVIYVTAPDLSPELLVENSLVNVTVDTCPTILSIKYNIGLTGHSICPDSICPDSISPDSIYPDSICPDSICPDSINDLLIATLQSDRIALQNTISSLQSDKIALQNTISSLQSDKITLQNKNAFFQTRYKSRVTYQNAPLRINNKINIAMNIMRYY